MANPTSGDEFLIELVRSGDQEAWRRLIDRYSGRLLAFARARMPSLADAEDLVQEAFVGFLQSLTYYDTSRSLETYLFTILRYKLYDVLRQRKPTLVSEPVESEEWWDQVAPNSQETPSGVALQLEADRRQAELLADILRRLIEDLRDRGAFEDLQVIELVFFAGKRNLEIGELLDIDQKAVAGVKFRAIQKLQKYLEELEPSDRPDMDETRADITVAKVWREQRLTCLKRGTLGSYVAGVLDEPWRSYTQFHLDVVGCPMCVANLNDLQAEQEEQSPVNIEKYFQSSVGFLSKAT